MTEDIEGLVDYKSPVELPYVPEGLEIVYVKETNPFNSSISDLLFST